MINSFKALMLKISVEPSGFPNVRSNTSICIIYLALPINFSFSVNFLSNCKFNFAFKVVLNYQVFEDTFLL